MGRRNDSWGIEIGANALKAIRLLRKGDDVSVAEYDVLPFKKVLTTPDLNVDEAIQLNLDQFLSRHQVSRSNVVVSVPGHMAFARFAKLPPVDPKQIPKIVHFEAVQQIPFPIDQVEWDYQVFAQPDAPDVEVGIVAITKDRVNQVLSNYKAVGLVPDGVTLSPMAVYNALAYDLELTPSSPGLIVMDVGTTSTDVIIIENGQIWLRTLPIGGNNFTDALVRSFKLSFPKAERLKREAGTSKYARQIFQAMRPVFADLLQEMQRSLGYYQSLNRDAKLTKVIGIGSTFRLPGIQKFLKQQLGMDVIRLDEFKRLKVDGKQEADFAEHTLNMATAYGLALQGLELEQVSTNMMPISYVKARVWRDKRPWIGVAAGLLLAASVGAGIRFWGMDQRAYETAKATHDRDITTIAKRSQDYVRQWDTLRGDQDPRPQIENIRSLLDYRNTWPEFMIDLDLALRSLNPQPELLTNNYRTFQGIPWDDRRRLYIETVNVDYHYAIDAEIGRLIKEEKAKADKAKADAAAAASGKSGTVGPAAPVAPAPGTPAGDAAKPDGVKPLALWDPAAASPVFTITIKGWTPNRDGATMLQNGFIKWLQDHTERKGRPYMIYASADPASCKFLPLNENIFGGADIERIGAAPAGGAQPAGGAPVAGGFGAAAPKTGGGFAVGSGGGAVDNKQQVINPFNSPIFIKPLWSTDAKPRQRGWQFEVTWRIRIVKPEDARYVEENAPPPAQPGTTPTPAPALKPAADAGRKGDGL